ncbi:peptidase inhibitor 16-like [Lates japonicus]
MLPLKWDPGLKLIAEGYATKCIWNHNPELEDTGENLFAGTGPLDLREALEKWFLEHLDYDYQNNSCDEDKMCGHYTQMVWAGTHRVGCAFHLCNNMEGLEWERVSFLVCNYYPAGNYEDERPYVEGDWCSSCPDNLQKCENNLCVEEDDEGGEGWGTDAPTPATSDPSLQPEEKNEEEKVPPPTTTDAQPATTTTPIPTPAPAPTSAPTVASTTASILTWDSEDTPLPATTAPDTPPPNVHSTTQREEEEWVEEKIQTHEEEEEVKRRWDEERKKTMDMMEREREKEVVQKTHPNTKRADSAGAVSSPSLLLVCLTGILTLRL